MIFIYKTNIIKKLKLWDADVKIKNQQLILLILVIQQHQKQQQLLIQSKLNKKA